MKFVKFVYFKIGKPFGFLQTNFSFKIVDYVLMIAIRDINGKNMLLKISARCG